MHSPLSPPIPEHVPDYAIEIEGLNKTYKSRKLGAKVALKDLSLRIPRGSLFGLLGPNGAGKSTLIGILGGIVIKTSGVVRIWGIDIDSDARNSRAAIGIVPQELNIDPFFTPAQLLDLHAGLYGVPKAERHINDILHLIGLYDKRDAYARTLSGGMRRRLLIGKAMVHRPPILVLDEPTAGVDIELRRQLWDNVQQLNKQGTTILLTTHYLEEAEQLCDRIAIINRSKLIFSDTKSKLLGKLDSKTLCLTIDRKPTQDLPLLAELTHEFATSGDGDIILKVQYQPSRKQAGELLKQLAAARVTIFDVSTDEMDLEDVFLQLISSDKSLP